MDQINHLKILKNFSEYLSFFNNNFFNTQRAFSLINMRNLDKSLFLTVEIIKTDKANKTSVVNYANLVAQATPFYDALKPGIV